jgi:hypothetical protein
MRIGIAAAVSLILGVLAATAQAGSTHALACAPKPITVKGNHGYVFCGPGRIIVRVGGKTYTVKGGTCTTQPGNSRLELQVGTVVTTAAGKAVNSGKPNANIGIGVGKPVIAGLDFYAAGRSYHAGIAVHGHVPSGGTFSGKDLLNPSHRTMTGSWTCGGEVDKLG